MIPMTSEDYEERAREVATYSDGETKNPRLGQMYATLALVAELRAIRNALRENLTNPETR